MFYADAYAVACAKRILRQKIFLACSNKIFAFFTQKLRVGILTLTHTIMGICC